MGTFYIQFITNTMSPGALVATSTKEERWFFLMPKSELQICVALEQKGQARGASVPGPFQGLLGEKVTHGSIQGPFPGSQ